MVLEFLYRQLGGVTKNALLPRRRLDICDEKHRIYGFALGGARYTRFADLVDNHVVIGQDLPIFNTPRWKRLWEPTFVFLVRLLPMV